ncbi:MAG: AIR carboxylase family protein [Nitrosospira sp.]|nr:AIR carboxylase family protein [Nitrosospira sp.]MDW7642215.1 AIR carboxylase family protein [Nitrosomonadaceae bacterium]MBI0407960.1 AIR carboxylase family protein [Nitrosospira sp.]MBI0413944.1 AIR carboxylase family protein [Nitrosospira sp.]MBI0415584.1 AIR carboxylase family protein [Nitrosospira sp.]
MMTCPSTKSGLAQLDSLLSIVQMPKGIPVATFAIGEAGAANAGLFAISLLALSDPIIAHQLKIFREQQVEKVKAMTLPILG